MKLSIIIPVYNVELYLEECIQSCLNQEAVDPSDYELILVNDGSTDGSAAIAKSFCSFENVRFINRSVNKGSSFSRNEGINASHGAYLWFVDSDDTISKYSVSSVLSEIYKNEPDHIYIGAYKYYSGTLTPEALERLNHKSLLPNIPEKTAYTCFSVWKRQFLDDNEIRFNSDVLRTEDALFYYEAMRVPHSVTCVKSVCYLYRHRDTSISKDLSIENQTKLFQSRVLKAQIVKEFFDKEKPKSYYTAAELLGDSRGVFLIIERNSSNPVGEMGRKIDYRGILPYRRIFEQKSAKDALMVVYTNMFVFIYRFVFFFYEKNILFPLRLWKTLHFSSAKKKFKALKAKLNKR